MHISRMNWFQTAFRTLHEVENSPKAIKYQADATRAH